MNSSDLFPDVANLKMLVKQYLASLFAVATNSGYAHARESMS